MIRIRHTTGTVKASIALPSSKSLSNRALVIRFLSGIDFPIHNLSSANDTFLLQQILENPSPVANVQDAGTAFRFLTAALAITPGEWVITGKVRLQERPVHHLVDALRMLGAEIHYTAKEGFAPLRIQGKKLKGGTLSIDASVSSQFVSALLMIAPNLDDGLVLKLTGEVASQPYISMTLQLMQHFGVSHEWNQNEIKIPRQSYHRTSYTVEPDWSAASYWFEIAALARQAEIFLEGLQPGTLQGDAVITSLMRPLGIETTVTTEGILISKEPDFTLPGFFEADLLATPDLAPAIVATLSALRIKSRISGIKNLNLKESRRKDILGNELLLNGIEIQSDDHSLMPDGGQLSADTSFQVHGDHRMAMCFAPLALRTNSVTLDDENVTVKSYPEYWSHLEKAGFTFG